MESDDAIFITMPSSPRTYAERDTDLHGGNVRTDSHQMLTAVIPLDGGIL